MERQRITFDELIDQRLSQVSNSRLFQTGFLFDIPSRVFK